MNDSNPKDNSAVAIDVKNSRSDLTAERTFCNLCSCNLILLDAQAEKWFCTRCNIAYYIGTG